MREKKFINLDTARTVGILWDANDQAAFNLLMKALIEKNIQFRDLCFIDQAKSGSDKEIAKKDFTIWGKPKKAAILNFMQEPFDLLIDISLSDHLQAQVIRAGSAALFKAGWSGAKPDFFDFSIDVSHQKDALYLAQQITYYLSEIK